MPETPSVLQMIGPVMIGPSSSHTAGALRLGRMARSIYGGTPAGARMLLGASFWNTREGHGTELALAAGLLGLHTADTRIREAFSLAAASGLSVSFEPLDRDGAHPNLVRFELSGPQELSIEGASVGGGEILVTAIDGFPAEITGKLACLFVVQEDRPGVIAQVSQCLAAHDINIAFMRVSRRLEDRIACMVLEVDGTIPPDVLPSLLALPAVRAARVIVYE